MKSLIEEFGRLRLAAVVIAALPLGILPLLGTIWLWESGLLPWWLAGLLGCAVVAYLLHYFSVRRERRALAAHTTQPAPQWPAEADGCWAEVEQIAVDATPDRWPPGDSESLWKLGRETVERVARYHHPEASQPLLELTVPHALTIVERAARELRVDIVANIPFSHRLTLGSLLRARHWRDRIAKHEFGYRVMRAAVAPHSALVSEFRRAVGNRIMGYGLEQVQTWLLREFVRKVGYHAIDLYSGRLLLGDEDPTARPTPASADASDTADVLKAERSEPLRIVVVGRANAGKSSLVNALFGELVAATDILPTTATVQPGRLTREGELEALVFDLPGCDTPAYAAKGVETTLRNADLVLWVTAANRADRAAERQQLDAIRQWGSDPAWRAPPILVVMSHVDRLRPLREWDPPYDLRHATDAKARNIVAALAVVAENLEVPLDRVIPACLEAGRLYNVEDSVWAAMLACREGANRVRLLRCMATRRREQNRELTWRQLANAGRFLRELPGRLF